MPVLEAADLDSLRSDVGDVLNDVFPDRGTVKRLGAKGTNVNHPVVATGTFAAVPGLENIPCRYRAASPNKQLVADANRGKIDLIIEVSAGLDIRNGDIFTVLAKAPEAAFDTEVVGWPIKDSNAVIMELLTIRR